MLINLFVDETRCKGLKKDHKQHSYQEKNMANRIGVNIYKSFQKIKTDQKGNK